MSVTLPLTRRERRLLATVLNQVWVDHHRSPIRIEVSLVSESEIRALHRDFLQDGSATDVITFDLGPAPDGWRVALISICLPVAQRHAEKYRVKLRQEVQRLIIHGVLHLLGYDDSTTAAKRRMRYHENKILHRMMQLESHQKTESFR
jgi:rRNA maturation RNase YbeY